MARGRVGFSAEWNEFQVVVAERVAHRRGRARARDLGACLARLTGYIVCAYVL